MATAENAKLEYEAGQSNTAMSALTDSGDRTTFTSAATLFSKKSGFDVDIRPNGVITAGNLISVAASLTNDVIDVSAFSCYLAGVQTAVGASLDEAVTRPATDVARINSVTVTSAGAIALIAGTPAADATFIETRGGAGGPPFIPVGDIEIGQIRMNTSAAAAITASEIFQVIGTHKERFDFPVWNTSYQTAEVVFISALDAIHTGSVGKAVYASYSDPIFTEISLASDYVPSETSHSVNSVQIYNTTLGSTSKTLNQGSFKAYLADGVSDAIVAEKDNELWFKFTPDRNKTPYILDLGKLGIKRTFPAGSDIVADCTISAAEAATEVNV